MSGILIAICWPWLLGPKPPSNAEPTIALRYVERMGLLVFSAVFCLICAGVGAMLVARVAREEYAQLKESNIRDLIEGAQEDISKKRSDA